VVFGATGAQGGSVCDCLLDDGQYKLRALVRDKTKEESKKLQNRGVELIVGDMSKPDSIPDSLLKDAYGVFLLTDFWDPSMKGRELELGKKLVDIIAKAGVKHIIFSSLPNVEKESNGKWKCPHFTSKAKVEEYIRENKNKFKYITFVQPAFYYQNFCSYFKITKDEKGNHCITLPSSRSLTAVDISQMGRIVCLCFNQGKKFDDQCIPIAGENNTPQGFVDMISKKLGKKIELKLIPVDSYSKTMKYEGSNDMADMFGWFDEYTFYGKGQDWSYGKKLAPLSPFSEWLDSNIQCFQEQVST